MKNAKKKEKKKSGARHVSDCPGVVRIIDGDISVAKIPSMVKRAMEILNALPDDAALSTRGLATRLNVGLMTLRQYATDINLVPFRSTARGSVNVFWSNPATSEKIRSGQVQIG